MHAYHHPEQIRSSHRWVDWFVEFDANDDRTNGLEFVEGLWANKLAVIAIVFSVAIIVVSIVWCLKGGQLQTVFSVMGFVLSFVAGESHLNLVASKTELTQISRNCFSGAVLSGRFAWVVTFGGQKLMLDLGTEASELPQSKLPSLGV